MNFEYTGLHLMIDALVAPHANLTKPAPGIQMLENMIERIEMTMMIPPVTVQFPHAVCEMKRVLDDLEREGLGESKTAKNLRERLQARKKESYGYSTFVMIAESHMSLHTFPELQYFSFDCYSCKKFDPDIVLEVMHEHFPLIKTESNLANRRVPHID